MNLVMSQIRQLRRGGYEPNFLVCENFGDAEKEYKEATVHKIIPVGHLEDYRKADLDEKHQELVDKTSEALIKIIDELGINLMLTHDVVFLGWHYPYALAVQKVSRERPDVKWMHWIHSIPSGMNPIWDIRKYGKNHKLVFPNKTEALRVAEQFRGVIEDVVPIHHVKDIREFAEFSEPTNRFIDEYGLMDADVIQIYPASVDRLEAKGIDKLMMVFGAMKTYFGKKVRLVICNQWCNVDKHRDSVEAALKRGENHGLIAQEDLIFTSRFEVPTWELGLPSKMVSELMMLGNLFMFPTREESFGLVLPEAALMGGCLVVANASLDMMREVTGNNALFWDFGSFYRDYHNDDESAYFRAIAHNSRSHAAQGIDTRYATLQFGIGEGIQSDRGILTYPHEADVCLVNTGLDMVLLQIRQNDHGNGRSDHLTNLSSQ